MTAEARRPHEIAHIWRAELQLPTTLKDDVAAIAEWSGVSKPKFLQESVFLRRIVGEVQNREAGRRKPTIYVEEIQLNPRHLLSAYAGDPEILTTFNVPVKFQNEVERFAQARLETPEHYMARSLALGVAFGRFAQEYRPPGRTGIRYQVGETHLIHNSGK